MSRLTIPKGAKKDAETGLLLKKVGYNGGTTTGWNRARQLVRETGLTPETLRVMRNWFARHRVTSYPGYKQWVRDGRPTRMIVGRKNQYRGALAWLIWGGTPAYNWIRSSEVQRALRRKYPDKKNDLPAITI